MLRLALILFFSSSIIFLYAQGTGEFDGTIQSNTLSGSGDRNVVADPSGVLKIGTTVGSSSLPATPVKGEMTYFDGTNWVTVPPGTSGQTLTMCNCVPTWGPCPTVAIGDMIGGGIVFWLDGNGGGLVAAPTDAGQVAWGCMGTDLPGLQATTAIGDGTQNTADIIAACTTPGIAADLCDTYTGGGFTDWFLPSIDELGQMYLNIGGGASGANNNLGNFIGSYWSSNEHPSSSVAPTLARVVNLTSGLGATSVQSSNKTTNLRVRPVRFF